MSLIRYWPGLVWLLATASAAAGAPPALIEVDVGKGVLQGKVAAHNESLFWLMGQDGRMRTMKSDSVKKFRQVSPQFAAWPLTTLRDQLRREFGKAYDVVGTRHYVVCARGEQKARAYAETFEELFRSFQMYFSVRGFKLHEPEFPLVAVIFPDYDSFSRYAKAEHVPVSRSLKGYYMSTSNRVALYDDPDATADLHGVRGDDVPEFARIRSGHLSLGGPHDFPVPNSGELGCQAEGGAWASIEASLKDTLIHEATHQVAFNTGLHTRIGENPKWVVEGLATVFESPGIRNPGGSTTAKTRINRERFVWFGNFSSSRRKPHSLEDFLASDDLFKSDTLDAYSQAWALSFFLIETRPRPYAEYLRTMAARDPLLPYSSAERVADFKKTVSKELPLLEAEFLRFIAGIR